MNIKIIIIKMQIKLFLRNNKFSYQNNLNNNNNKNNKNFIFNYKSEDNLKITENIRINILKTLNKEELKKLVLNLPKREQTKLNDFKEHLKKETQRKNEFEKAYILFYWMHENIEYDTIGFRTGKMEVTPEVVYSKGRGVCSGYSRLFKFLSDYIGIKVFCIDGYSKGFGYYEGKKFNDINHEWNVLEVNNNYFFIDATWGAGNVNNNYIYEKNLKEFYFLPSPQEFIFSHFPKEGNWQLLDIIYTLNDFTQWINFNFNFFNFFNLPNNWKDNIPVSNRYILKLSKKNNKCINLFTNVYFLENNIYYENKGCKVLIQYRKNYIYFILLFQFIGKYKFKIFGSYKDDENDPIYKYLTSYHFICNTNLDYINFFFEPEDLELQYNTFDEILENFECENISHKDISFNAKDKEKLIFNFKKDSNIFIKDIELFLLPNLDQDSKIKLKNQLKYIISKNNLEIDAIFNDKGNYNIKIIFMKKDTYFFKEINYFPKKIEDSKQKNFFSFEEYLIHNLFDESLKNLHLNYISHKNQIINVKETEIFEFESSCERLRYSFYSFEEDDENNVFCKKIYLNDNSNRLRLNLTFDMKGKYILKFTLTCNCKITEDIYYIANYDPDSSTEKISNTYKNEIEKNQSNKLKIKEEIELYKALMVK